MMRLSLPAKNWQPGPNSIGTFWNAAAASAACVRKGKPALGIQASERRSHAKLPPFVPCEPAFAFAELG